MRGATANELAGRPHAYCLSPSFTSQLLSLPACSFHVCLFRQCNLRPPPRPSPALFPQVLLYLLLMEERYGHPLEWGMLWYTHQPGEPLLAPRRDSCRHAMPVIARAGCMQLLLPNLQQPPP